MLRIIINGFSVMTMLLLIGVYIFYSAWVCNTFWYDWLKLPPSVDLYFIDSLEDRTINTFFFTLGLSSLASLFIINLLSLIQRNKAGFICYFLGLLFYLFAIIVISEFLFHTPIDTFLFRLFSFFISDDRYLSAECEIYNGLRTTFVGLAFICVFVGFFRFKS